MGFYRGFMRVLMGGIGVPLIRRCLGKDLGGGGFRGFCGGL